MKHDLFTAYASYYCNTESNPNIRVPDVIECVARIFGYKRGQPFFGNDGDKIAARYQSRCGWNWADDIEQAPDPTPWWVAQGRRNENMAYILVLFMALLRAVDSWHCGPHTPRLSIKNSPLLAGSRRKSRTRSSVLLLRFNRTGVIALRISRALPRRGCTPIRRADCA